MLETLFSNPIAFLVLALSLVTALTVHEFAHAFVADHLGDPTPRSYGRLTLNPLAHLDPIGTMAILLVGFGWGKPVPIDVFNLRGGKKDAALISLAGPASNLILAILLSLLLKFTPLVMFGEILLYVIQINVMLAIFNLVPVFPLDGEKIMLAILPAETAAVYAEIMQQYGTLILILLIFPFSGSSALSSIISPIISFVTRLLL